MATQTTTQPIPTIHNVTTHHSDVFSSANNQVAVPEQEFHSIRCSICHNVIWIEDLQVLDGRPLCPTHYVQHVTLPTPNGTAAVIVIG